MTSVTVRQLHQGVPHFKMSEWMALNKDGSCKHQQSLADRLANAEKLITTPVSMDGQTTKWGKPMVHESTRYDTLLFGCLNDGTSITIHVQDFEPWVVYQFRDKKVKTAEICRRMDNQVKKKSAQLAGITYVIEPRACSDGMLMSKKNPYKERKYLYVYVFNKDASYACRVALQEAMDGVGAQPVEDYAMDASLRFLQKNQQCPTDWYTCLDWREVQYGFVTSTQIEISCKMADLIPMIDEPKGVVLPPHTEAYYDIEHHKFEDLTGAGEGGAEEQGSKRGFASPDDPLNTLICINAAVWRTGAFDSIPEDDLCRRNMPRMDDVPVHLGAFRNANPTDDPCMSMPDPLAVEQSMGRHLKAVEEELESAFEALEIEDDDDDPFAASALNDMKLDVHGGEEVVPIPEELPYTRTAAEALVSTIQTTSIGNMMAVDLDAMDNIEALAERVLDEKISGKTNSMTILNSDNDFSGKNIVEKSEAVVEPIPITLPESTDALLLRHGYEIPEWVYTKLRARVDLNTVDLGPGKTEKNRSKTLTILNQCKHIRRLCWYVDPFLPTGHAKFLLKPLYKDQSDGILVYAYKKEAHAILAFRDFLVAVHPDMTCGHFTRSYDWKTIFTRANCSLGEMIPCENTTKDEPIVAEKLMTHLPVLERSKILSTKENPFPVQLMDDYYNAATYNGAGTGPSGGLMQYAKENHLSASTVLKNIKDDVKERQAQGRELLKKTNRKTAFSYMNRLLFEPVHLTRKITHSGNTATVESVYPEFDGTSDVDSLIAIRLAYPGLKKFGLNVVSEEFLCDAKMDITIPRMNAGYRQRQHWANIAYCDYDCVLVGALISVLSIRNSHAALSKCTHTSMHVIVNSGQQKRIYNKNAVVAHRTGLVLVKGAIICPQIFGGGHVGIPVGGIYPVPCNCLDFVSYYVSIMMEYNLCFTTYNIPWDKNFDPIPFDPKDPITIFKAYRQFQRNLRDVYGAPEYRKRPATLPYYTCLRCGGEDFSLVPENVKTAQELDALPTHEQLSLNSGLAADYPRCVPDKCPTCARKPWVQALEKECDNSQVPDATSPLDPYREERYAAEYDYLVSRSSRVTLQTDPEAILMHKIKRYRPGSDTEFVREDLLTEHEEFDWIDDNTWASNRLSICYKQFLQDLKDKKSKGKKKRDLSNTPYIPSMASFALWRKGDFDNQSKFVYQKNGYSCEGYAEDEAENAMLAEVGADVWSVDSFKEYADYTSQLADEERWKAFLAKQPFDRTRFDIRCRRGILKFGSTTGSVEEAFVSRNETKAEQTALKEKFYIKSQERWTDNNAKTHNTGLEAMQIGKKLFGNSCFGAAGDLTSGLANSFIAAGITSISRNDIYYVTYKTLTDWTPPTKEYKEIVEYRKISIEGRAKYTGVTKEYFDRYVAAAPWPTTPEAGRQVWLKPIRTSYEYRYNPVESLFQIMSVYGDTDSIFACMAALVLGSPDEALFAFDELRRKLAMNIGRSQAAHVTKHFRMFCQKWMTIDFEKMMYAFFLFDGVKKRYIGGHWDNFITMLKITVRSWNIKRDMAVFLQGIGKSVRDELVKTMSGDSLDALFEKKITELLANGGKIQILERDVIPFSKSQAFKKTDYVNPVAHVEANNRLARAFPGFEHDLGDRIEYVVCYNPALPEITQRSWTVKQLDLMLKEKDACIKMGVPYPPEIDRLRIDLTYYIGLFITTIDDVFTITKPPKQIYQKKSKFLDPTCMLQRLSAAGHLPNVLLPNSSMDAHLEACNAILEDRAPEPCKPMEIAMLNAFEYDDMDAVALTNNSLIKGLAGVTSLEALTRNMEFAASTVTSKPTKKKSDAAKAFCDKYMSRARALISRSYNEIEFGIGSFFKVDNAMDVDGASESQFAEFEALQKERRAQQLLRQQESERIAAAQEEARLANKKRAATSMPKQIPWSKKPKFAAAAGTSSILSFFKK